MTKKMSLIIVTAAIIYVLILALSAQQVGLRYLPFSEALGEPQGEAWLRLTADQRDGYVRGYLDGYRRAADLACRFDLESYDKCRGEQARFSKPVETYAAAILGFYTHYPQNRRLPITYLLEFVSDQKHMSPEEIDKWCEEASEQKAKIPKKR